MNVVLSGAFPPVALRRKARIRRSRGRSTRSIIVLGLRAVFSYNSRVHSPACSETRAAASAADSRHNA
jgi:hypothetical protein